MDNNGKINRGIDLGTTNSAIAVMENGAPVIKKSNTQKDTIPSIVSITRKGIIHTGDTAANELANQVLRATKTWDGRTVSTDIFKEFKRTMGTVEVYRSKNLKKDFTSQQLSAEIIKALAANAEVNDGGSIVISVPAKFDATQKAATVEAARLAGFQHIELIQAHYDLAYDLMKQTEPKLKSLKALTDAHPMLLSRYSTIAEAVGEFVLHNEIEYYNHIGWVSGLTERSLELERFCYRYAATVRFKDRCRLNINITMGRKEDAPLFPNGTPDKLTFESERKKRNACISAILSGLMSKD